MKTLTLLTIFVAMVAFPKSTDLSNVEPGMAQALAAEYKSPPNMSNADLRHAVQAARDCDHAIIFVHVDWSPVTSSRRKIYSEFMVSYAMNTANPDTKFAYINFTHDTDYSTLRDIPGLGQSLIHGSEEIVFLDHGRVVATERIGFSTSTNELITRTLSLWSREISTE